MKSGLSEVLMQWPIIQHTQALLMMEKYFSIHVLDWLDKGTGVGKRD